MNQVYLVIEDNGESYDAYQEWAIAAFDDREKADAYAKRQQQEYDLIFAEGRAIYPKFIKEAASLGNANPYDWKQDNEKCIEVNKVCNEYLENKYPNPISEWESKHSFTVSDPIPFNPL